MGNKISFASQARVRRQPNTTAPQALSLNGSTYNFELDRTGFLRAILLKVSGTVTLSSGGAFPTDGFAPFNVIDKIRLNTKGGGTIIFDVNGYSLKQYNDRLKNCWSVDGGGNYTPNILVYQAPVASGVNNWTLHYLIPLSQNLGSSFTTGLFALQGANTQATLQIQTISATSALVSNYSSSALTAQIQLDICDVPQNPDVMLPALQVIKTVTNRFSVTQTGENLIEIPAEGILQDVQMVSVFNGTRSDALDYIKFRTNYNNYFETQLASDNAFWYEYNYGKPKPKGVWALDFQSDLDMPTVGSGRDAFLVQRIAKTELVPVITSGTTISGTSYFDVTTRHLINLASN